MSREPKIPQKSLREAREFLKTHPIGQRFQVAEHALTLLTKNELPRLRQFVFNASFDLRQISDSQKFEKLAHLSGSDDDLLRESRCGGYVKVGLGKERIRIVLFYEKKLNKNEAFLYARSLGEITAVTYGALGMDMSVLQIPSEIEQSGSTPTTS